MRRRGHTLPHAFAPGPGPVPFNITTSSPLPTGNVGTPYDVQLETDSTHLPTTFYKSTGALPAGLTLTADGRIYGTPTETGDFNIRINCIDASSYTTSKPFTITITDIDHFQVALTPPPDNANGGLGYTQDDILTLIGGTATTPATFRADVDESDGHCTNYTVVNQGDYTVTPTEPVAFSGGTGAGAMCINVPWEPVP